MDAVAVCIFDDCVETVLITLVILFAVMPLYVDTITGLMVALPLILLLNEDDDDDDDIDGDDVDIFGIMLAFCGKFDTVLYSMIGPPFGLN